MTKPANMKFKFDTAYNVGKNQTFDVEALNLEAAEAEARKRISQSAGAIKAISVYQLSANVSFAATEHVERVRRTLPKAPVIADASVVVQLIEHADAKASVAA